MVVYLYLIFWRRKGGKGGKEGRVKKKKGGDSAIATN